MQFSPYKYLRDRSGFTLVELLLVMVMIGSISTLLAIVINPAGQFKKSRDVTRKNDLAQITRALEQYYNDFNSYPPTSANPNYFLIDDAHGWGNSWAPYMDVLPSDPLSTQRYIYTSSGQAYVIYAHLERNEDPGTCNVQGSDCPNVPAANLCGSGIAFSCNFGISSPNVSP